MSRFPLSPHDQSTTRARDLALVALVAALALLFFWRILTPRLEDRAVFPSGDFTDQFWAFRMVEARAFAQGRLPLWSDNYNSGHPFLADVQSAVYYPIGLVFTFAVVLFRGGQFTVYDLELEAIAHFILAGIFTYLFVRRRVGSRLPALLSAVTFTFGGYLTSYPPLQLAILETATWLPLALLLLDLGVERGVVYLLAAGVVLGIAALAGHPQTFLFLVYACVIYFTWRLAVARFHAGSAATASPTNLCKSAAEVARLAIPRLLLVAIVAAGIAAAQWVPTLEYQAVSTRAAMSWEQAAGGFPTIDPLQMILPGFVGSFQSPLYIGILPLWLAALALFVNRSGEKVFWAALALGSLLVSFGSYAFAYAPLYLFAPGLGLFRDQERLALVVSFSLAVLAGYGFRDLLEPSVQRRQVRRAWALLPAGLTASLLLLFSFYVAATNHSSGHLAFLLDRTGLMVLIFLLAALLAAWRISSTSLSVTSTRTSFAVLAVGLVVFDLFSIDTAAYNARAEDRYPTTPMIRIIQSDPGVFRVADEGKMPGHFGIGYNLEEIGGISPLRVARYDALLDLPPEVVWPLLGVRYVITGRPGFANADVVMAEGDARLLRLNNTLPRAWFVRSAQGDVADSRALDQMQQSSFDPRQSALVADPLPISLSSPSRETTGVDVQGAAPVSFQERDPEHLTISTTAPTDGLLVLSEVYYPGWIATVDGTPTPILRADYALRAVPLRAGAHRVEMVFDPWSVKVGLAISLVTIAGLAAAAAASGPLPLRSFVRRTRTVPPS